MATQGLGYVRAAVEAVFDPITDELVRQTRDGYRMVREHDAAFLDNIDPGVEWHVSDTLPRGGVLRGSWAVLEFMEAVDKPFEGATPDAEEFLQAGDRLIVLGTWRGTARATGVLVEVPFAHVQQFRHGKIAYFHNYIDTAKVLQSLEEAPPG